VAAALLAATPALAANPGTSDGGVMAVWIIITVCYFFPAIIAAFRKHHNLLAIFLLNLFLGWTFLGWIGALVWAATAVRRKEPEYY
jgi:hypothetical protein